MLSQLITAYDLLDSAVVTGEDVVKAVNCGELAQAKTFRVAGAKRTTDFVRVVIPGTRGKLKGGEAPTLAVVGRLGGLGVRPVRSGIVSDADGAIVAVACALKLCDMKRKGDELPGDVVIVTHVCPDAETKVNDGVQFMASPVTPEVLNQHCMDPEADAVLSVDATKGNRILNHRGIAITPTVKEGYILRVSPDLVGIYERVTCELARVLPITTQDITPYGNDIYHINSIMQPSVVTKSPVVGVAVCAQSCVPGSATGANNYLDLELAGRFVIETAKLFTAGELTFYDEPEYQRLVSLYGEMKHLQTLGRR